METGIVIFNGIQFSLKLVNRAIEWAEKNRGSLQALFLHSAKEPPEGYIFPSDMDPAENLYDKQDARKSNEAIIHSQVRLFRDMAAAKNIPAQTWELTDPSIKNILEIMEGATILFMDADHDKAFLLKAPHLSLKKIEEHCRCPVEIVDPGH